MALIRNERTELAAFKLTCHLFVTRIAYSSLQDLFHVHAKSMEAVSSDFRVISRTGLEIKPETTL